MKVSNIVLMTCASLVLGTANAGAGACNQEIMDVTKMLAATDAGSAQHRNTRTYGRRPKRSASRYFGYQQGSRGQGYVSRGCSASIWRQDGS